MSIETYTPSSSSRGAPTFDSLDYNSPENDREISLLELLTVLAEQKRIISAVVGAFAIVALVVSFLLPRRYTATAVVLPPQNGSTVSSALATQLGSLGGMMALAGNGLGIKNPNDLQVSLLKSRTAEDAMIHHFNLMQEYRDRYISDARKDLERNIDIDGSEKDGLIRIAVTDRSPGRAAELANGYVAEFRSLSESLATTEASQRRLFFEEQLQQAKERLADAEEALKSTEQKTGMIQLDSQARALIETAAGLRAQISAKEVQIQAMRTYENGRNADLVVAQQELEGLRAQLAKLGGTENGAGELILPKGAVPEAGLEYVRRLRDVKYYETIFDILARQYELAKLDEAKQGGIIQVVDAAVPPDKKSFPPRALIVLGGVFLGLLLGAGFALLREALYQLQSQPVASMRLHRLKRALAWKRGQDS